MKINKISMAIIAATSLLAVCPAVYAQTPPADNPPAATPPARPRGGGGPTLESIDKAVTLTDAEKPKVTAALADLTKAMAEARAADQSERRTKMTDARNAFSKTMEGILTPD